LYEVELDSLQAALAAETYLAALEEAREPSSEELRYQRTP
jgi:hypothetical protein